MNRLELLAGVLLLAACAFGFGHAVATDAQWRLARRRIRNRRRRTGTVDLTGAKSS